jgi:hypothetical protein
VARYIALAARHLVRANSAERRVRRRDVRISLFGLPLAVVCLAGFVPACSAQGADDRTLPGHGPADGTVTGHPYGASSPLSGVPRPWPGTVTLAGPCVHRDVRVGVSGRYSVMVPPGRYTVVGRSPLYNSGSALCHAAAVATVTSGHTTKADVWCRLK